MKLKETLDRFYEEYDFRERLAYDPVKFPHRYTNPEDVEIAGFIAAAFAYGHVDLFSPVIEDTLTSVGRSPRRFFSDFSLNRDARHFRGVAYRFNREKDIICFLYFISRAVREWGSLKNLFYEYYRTGHEDSGETLKGVAAYFLNMDTSPVYGENIKPLGIKQLFPSPLKGSACKRMNLYLRWMVRRKDIDFGIWDNISPSSLVVPLDTHIARISRCLGLTARKSDDWKTAEGITDSLKRFDPQDPLKYDFALCHQGISGICRMNMAGDSRVTIKRTGLAGSPECVSFCPMRT